MRVNVKVKRLSDSAVIPSYANENDAGFDLVASEDVIIQPGETKIVPTGLAMEIPPHYEIQVRPRSGITVNTKLRVQLGTVDCGFRGGIGIIVDNIAAPVVAVQDGDLVPFMDYPKTLDGEYGDGWYPRGTYVIRKGDRLGQGVINQHETALFSEVSELSDSERGEGGFGSTGIKEGI
jgi:dUTP pyrophosphatase